MPRGLTPPEIAYICEMEMVTVLPRQRLDALELLGVSISTRVTLRMACSNQIFQIIEAQYTDNILRDLPQHLCHRTEETFRYGWLCY